jgi:uncharacterized membrane protein
VSARETSFQSWRRKSNERLCRFGPVLSITLFTFAQLSIHVTVAVLLAVLENDKIEPENILGHSGKWVFQSFFMAIFFWLIVRKNTAQDPAPTKN